MLNAYISRQRHVTFRLDSFMTRLYNCRMPKPQLQCDVLIARPTSTSFVLLMKHHGDAYSAKKVILFLSFLPHLEAFFVNFRFLTIRFLKYQVFITSETEISEKDQIPGEQIMNESYSAVLPVSLWKPKPENVQDQVFYLCYYFYIILDSRQ